MNPVLICRCGFTALVVVFLLHACSPGSTEGPEEVLLPTADNVGSGDGGPDTVINPTDQTGLDFSGDYTPSDLIAEIGPQCDPGEGCFLDECTDNSQCDSGWCVDHMGTGVCTQNCQEECPPGWSCQQVNDGGPDVVFICISDFANLCIPCSVAGDCTNLGGADDACLGYPGEGNFCGGSCESGKGCPSGFDCKSALTVDGIELQQCVATSDTCECTDKSIKLGLWTSCDVTTAEGTCSGKRVCVEGGLSDCDAPAPEAETCNGLDDDCDSLVDEPTQDGGDFIHLCDDDNDCTEDVCNGSQGCAHLSLSGTPCNTPDPCSSAFSCQDGVCIGEPISCDDGKICTVDTCDPGDGHCINQAKNENCPSSNNPCVSNVFCDPFADETSDPNQDGCVVTYKPEGTGCNDSDACTTGEICQTLGNNLICQGSPIEFADENPCTNDWCDPLVGPQHDLIPGCEAPCEPGQILTGPCGKCGIHSKTCPGSGKYSDADWSECSGEGDCLVGEQGSILCGDCGYQSHTCNEQCQWGEWGPCINQGACTPNDAQYDACEGECTSKQRYCNDSCQWGSWGVCQVVGDCNPNENETQGCGNCGNQLRTCTDLCVWSPWGECGNQGLCASGELDTQTCGLCGSQTRNCLDSCQWDGWSPCIGEGSCQVGQNDQQGCGYCGSQTRTCVDGCVWTPWTDCLGEGECPSGQEEQISCGECAAQTRTCSNQCQWTPWSECNGGGVCTPDEQDTQPCGNCGSQTRSCTNDCIWGEWGNCLNQGNCVPGEQGQQDCGYCGSQTRSCDNACQWTSWTNCGGQGVCSPGEKDTDNCGNCGTDTRTCTNSCSWGNWSGCLNQGECSPNQTQTQGCGNCGTQVKECEWDCDWGWWGDCNDPCACECNGGTCCSNGCDYDNYGTPCGGSTCKQCNGNGSCVNKNNGTACIGGECYNGQCVECLNGETEDCDPNCGVFSDPGDGVKTCSNNDWGDCKPVWCKNSNWPVYYPIAPLDHNWHCGYVSEFNMYLCVEVVLSWICADYLEFRFMKSWNVYGSDETGPWDNDIKIVVRNTNNNKTWTQNKVSCAGNSDASGGCAATVGNSVLTGTLDVTGTDSIEVDIYSPYSGGPLIGTTGKIKIKECF